MAQSYLLDKKIIVPCATKLKAGQYGVDEALFVGAPAKIGAKGVEDVIEVELTEKEMANLQVSIDAVKDLNAAADKLGLSK